MSARGELSPTATTTQSPFYRIAWAFYLALAVAGLLWIGFQRGRIGWELFFDPGQPGLDLALGLSAGGILLAFWWGLRRISLAARRLEAELSRLVAPLSTAEALALAFLSALAEELFFRGALQTALGLLPATVLFSLLHTGPGRSFRLWTLFALVAGLVLGTLVLLRGALASAIVAHLVVNGVNLVRMARRGASDTPAVPGDGDAAERRGSPAEGPLDE